MADVHSSILSFEEDKSSFNKEYSNYAAGCFPCSGFRIYSLLNLLRFLSIGVLIFTANYLHYNTLEDNYHNCCGCHLVSTNITDFSINQDTKFDLSYCIPKCVDCNFCDTLSNATDIPNCPANTYSAPTSLVNSNWNTETGCNQNNIRIKSFAFFQTSYEIYGIAALGTSFWYCLILSMLIYFEATRYAFKMATARLLQVISIYNTIFAEICLYLLFIPYQYYQQHFNVQNQNIKCLINDTSNQILDIQTVIVSITIIMVILYHCLILFNCSYRCVRQCRNKRKEPQVIHIHQELTISAEQGSEYNTTTTTTSTKNLNGDIYSFKWKTSQKLRRPIYWIWCIVVILMVVFILAFLIILSISINIIIRSQIKNKNNLEIVVTILVLLVSTLDLLIWNVVKTIRQN